MNHGLAGRIARAFITSKLTPLFIAGFLAIGLISTMLTPSEEEPQITVPMADVFFRLPGAGPQEVESRVTNPAEQIISNIPGVEYVYSTSMPGQAMIIVRYFVGQDMERSLFKLYNELQKFADRLPRESMPPFIKTRSIDDVPIVSLTLSSEVSDDRILRSVGLEIAKELKKIPDVAGTQVIGGRSRQIRVYLDRERMAANSVDPLSLIQHLSAGNQQATSGMYASADTEYVVESGSFFNSSEDIGNLIVGVNRNSPVYVRNIARVVDGLDEPGEYVRFGWGKGAMRTSGGESESRAVTLTVSKRKGADARRIADQVAEKIERLKGTVIPADIGVVTTRNYGETSSEKVRELLKHLSLAILAVTVLVGLAMGWRSGIVVFASVPVTFALTLFVYYLFGYTLNRITLFALVFVTGIVVDDSIIVVENMHRHFKMKKLPFLQAAIASIDEVGNPTILATFTVIAAVLPMAFVSGLMGPYMSPMPIGASLAMMFSLLVALVITPWLAFRLLKNDRHETSGREYRLEETLIYRWYDRAITPLLGSARKRWVFLTSVSGLLLAALLLFVFRLVPVKMLPFDNKNEVQVIIDMPEGTTLERTAAVTGEIAAWLRGRPFVVNYQSYVGTSGPINFNGLVRHYDLRRGSNVADIEVNLVAKSERRAESHDIAREMRPAVQEIGRRYGANVKVAEVPPGPPVVSTLVAEVYGPTDERRAEVARRVRAIFDSTAGVVDVDWMREDNQIEYRADVRKEKASLAGIPAQQVVGALSLALGGMPVTAISAPRELEPVPVVLQLDEDQRSGMSRLGRIRLQSPSGAMVPLSELVDVSRRIREKAIYHKNQQPVVYVTADVAGALESPVYAILDMKNRISRIASGGPDGPEQLFTRQPFMDDAAAIKWDGEWHITYEVFRDLGSAFLVVLLIIYLLIVGWFQSFKVPFVMMLAIPLSLIGILIGHWIMGAFFTATSMIGLIALAGIMVRNSVLLIDFIEIRLADGASIQQAIVEAGAVRMTPILLTSGAVVIGALVILFDPIFQGLAIALIGGSIASTVLTLVIVPLIYYLTEREAIARRTISKEGLIR